MTRSDNPFGDLPEWKERQRLQEAQGNGAHPGGYQQQPAQAGGYAAPQPQYPPHDGAPVAYPQGYDEPAYPQQGAPASYYPEQTAQRSPLHYNIHPDGQAENTSPPHGHPAPHPSAVPAYDPHTQVTYPVDPPADPNVQYDPGYGAPGQAAQGYNAGHGQPGPHDLGLRPGHYDDRGAYEFGGQHPALDGYGQLDGGVAGGQASAYNFDSYAPGQPPVSYEGGAAAPGLEAVPGGAAGDWDVDQTGQAAAGALVATRAPHGADGDYDEDDDEYYDDDIEDGQRYSWKLLAAVVVTGAVVTGGGVVLYDSFTGGGSGRGGDAPIIRADQGPSKTAPGDAGGRKFEHRDSKLLGRLDTLGGAKQAGDAEGGNRVRSVPTVKIGRDGRLILPEAPKAVAAPAAESQGNSGTTDVAGGRIAPGINVVNSLNGSDDNGLGGTLPPAMPQAEKPSSSPQQPTVVTRQAAVAPKVTPLNASPAAPAAAKPSSRNLATARKPGPPPVPSKSSVGSAWRMTSAGAAAKAQPKVGGVEPTIARPVQPAFSPQTRTSNTASTLGARSVAKPQGGGYVAVLATAPSRMKALQSFAELQQKHPAPLQGRVPDVQRADLSARGLGIMYRVVVGPAGSRDVANSVCSSLKAEGYKGCWVKPN